MGIVVVGSVAIDDVITPTGRNFDAPGGSATYFSLSASYFTKVRLVAVVGTDFPKKYIRLLESRGIDTKGLVVEKGKTFRWKGVYSKDMDSPRTIATHLNLFETFQPVLPQEYRDEDVVFLANIDPDLQLDVLRQVRSPRLTAADTMNFWIGNKRKQVLQVMKKVDIFILNEHEARQLSGESNLISAGRRIISLGGKKVVIKKGENGLMLVTGKDIFITPSYPLENVKDPTGAGDTFAGGLLGYLAAARRIDIQRLRKALIYANIMASLNVEGFDIKRLSNLNRDIIDRRLRHFKSLCCF